MTIKEITEKYRMEESPIYWLSQEKRRAPWPELNLLGIGS